MREYLTDLTKDDFIGQAVEKCYYDYYEWAVNKNVKPVGKSVFEWEIYKKFNLNVKQKHYKKYFTE